MLCDFSWTFSFCVVAHMLIVPSFCDGERKRNHKKELIWADFAYDFIHTLNCNDVFFTTTKECKKLIDIPKYATAFYLAPPTSLGRYKATLPDESLTRKTYHDAVLAIDPYPTANFGHLILVFYVDLRTHRSQCKQHGDVYLGNGACMTLAVRRRCKNIMERRGKRRNFARRCEINFLPFVSLERRNNEEYTKKRQNHLVCLDDLPGYSQCRELRPENETTDLVCNPLKDNTKRCATTHETVHTSCRLFEVCDQAVIISGGWNRQTTGTLHKANAEAFYWMLRQNGFGKRNIKVFFANGDRGIEIQGEHPHRFHPAAMKLAFRYHIQRMCKSPHCVDSLVLYLNSPAKNDGTFLLWDVNVDGLADDNERYSIKELKHDLNRCKAKNVHVIVDQSYSGQVAQSFQNSENHKNVVVYASSRSNEYSFEDDFTMRWVGTDHTNACLSSIHQSIANDDVMRSTPEIAEGSVGISKTTIFGSPCALSPPFTRNELQRDYLGCQNLPTALWLMKILDSPGSRFPIMDPDQSVQRNGWHNR
ncbi:hypothetical protein ScPMuIL_015229 [Solemya velum]